MRLNPVRSISCRILRIFKSQGYSMPVIRAGISLALTLFGLTWIKPYSGCQTNIPEAEGRNLEAQKAQERGK